MDRFCFPVELKEDNERGGYTVVFKDLPEAITEGDDLKEALRRAGDCLDEALAHRISAGLEIPRPSQVAEKGVRVAAPALMAAKAAFYLAFRDSKMTRVELARQLGCDEKEVRRMLDPKHNTKIPRIECALRKMGKTLVVSVDTVA